MQAGFEECRIVCLEYPTSQALIGVKPNRSALAPEPRQEEASAGAPARTVQDRVLGRKWFYRFQLPGGAVTDSYSPAPVASIHETREQMMFSVLDPLVGSGWEQATAMDLGCHEGYFAHRLAAKGCARVVGVDARGESIENANLLRSAFGRTNVEFQVGEVQALEPTRLGTFDIVLLFGLLYHLEDPVAALRLARRLTRRVCLLETQLAPNLGGILDWGTSSTVKSIQGSFAIIDETPELASGNREANLRTISLVPSLEGLLWLMRALDFARVEVVPPPANAANEQLRTGKRVMVAGYVGN